MFRKIFLGIFVLQSLFIFSQRDIKGVLINARTGRIIPESFNIIFKDSSDVRKMEFVSVTGGKFYYKFKESYQTLIIRVVGRNFEEKKLVFHPSDTTHLRVQIKLYPIKVEELEEVIIESDRSVKEKQDTLIYDVKKFITGEEKKLKDLLKKLPGLEVDKNGKISYRGKYIKTLLLDGSDMFDKDYNIATKHLNADLVDRVELYNNYEDNPALSGLRKTGDLAINILLKENASGFSGDVTPSLGINTNRQIKNNSGITLLTIRKKLKGFTVGTYNNTGINHSPQSFYSFYRSIENFDEINDKVIYPVSESYFSTILDEEKVLFNNQFFINQNLLLKPSAKTEIQAIIYAILDKVHFRQNTETFYETGNGYFFSDNLIQTKKPQYFKGDFKFKKRSKKKYLVYSLKSYYKVITLSDSVLPSWQNRFLNFLKSRERYFSQELQYTWRRTSHSAIVLRIKQSYNRVLQNYNITNISIDSSGVQNVSHERNTVSFRIKKYLSRNNAEYHWEGGILSKYDFFLSAMDFPSFKYEPNLFSVKNHQIYVQSNSTNYLNRIKLTSKVKLGYLFGFIQTTQKTEFLFDSKIHLSYDFTNHFKLISLIGASRNIIDPENAFPFGIYSNYLSVIQKKYENFLQLKAQSGINLVFSNNSRIFLWNIGYQFNLSKGGYFPDSYLSTQHIYTSYTYLNSLLRSHRFSLTMQKFFYDFKTDVKLAGIYILSENLSKLNSPAFFKRVFHYMNIKFSAGTAFHLPVNFRYGIQMKYSQSVKDIVQFFYHAGVVGHIGKILVNIDAKLYDLDKSHRNLFKSVDARFNWKPSGKNIEMELILNNLFSSHALINRILFYNGYTITGKQLQYPYALLSVTYSF